MRSQLHLLQEPASVRPRAVRAVRAAYRARLSAPCTNRRHPASCATHSASHCARVGALRDGRREMVEPVVALVAFDLERPVRLATTERSSTLPWPPPPRSAGLRDRRAATLRDEVLCRRRSAVLFSWLSAGRRHQCQRAHVHRARTCAPHGGRVWAYTRAVHQMQTARVAWVQRRDNSQCRVCEGACAAWPRGLVRGGLPVGWSRVCVRSGVCRSRSEVSVQNTAHSLRPSSSFVGARILTSFCGQDSSTVSITDTVTFTTVVHVNEARLFRRRGRPQTVCAAWTSSW